MRLLIDAIVRIKNGSRCKRLEVKVNNSRFIRDVLNKLVQDGVIRGYSVDGFYLKVLLKYSGGKPLIHDIELLSVPRRPVYLSFKDIMVYFKRKEFVIFSTSKGIMSSYQISLVTGTKDQKVGGIGLFKVSINGS